MLGSDQGPRFQILRCHPPKMEIFSTNLVVFLLIEFEMFGCSPKIYGRGRISSSRWRVVKIVCCEHTSLALKFENDFSNIKKNAAETQTRRRPSTGFADIMKRPDSKRDFLDSTLKPGCTTIARNNFRLLSLSRRVLGKYIVAAPTPDFG